MPSGEDPAAEPPGERSVAGRVPRGRTTGRRRTAGEQEPPGQREPPTLIDASALIAFLGGEPAAGEVGEILRRGAEMTAVNLVEAVDRLGRRYGLEMDRLRRTIESLLEDSLEVIPVTSVETWRAAAIRIAHYHRSACPISLADAVLIAFGGPDRRIATSDSHVLRIASREGIEVIPLPDSQGRRPE